MNDKEAYKNGVLANYEELEIELMVLLLLTLQENDQIEMYNRIEFRHLQHKVSRETYKEALKIIRQTNSQNKKDLKQLYNEQAVGKEYDIEKERNKILKEHMKITDKNLNKLAIDMAKGVRKEITNMMGNVYKQVSTGQETFDIGFKNTADDLYKKGITFTDKIGRNRSIEATVRQDLLYRINNMNREIYKKAGDKMNSTGVQINISPNCRDTHQVINGKTFTNEEWKQYEYLTEEYNCQHVAKPIFIEFQNNQYTQKEIDEANNRTVTYKGEKIPYYEATQKQRALERAIRNAKKSVIASKKTGIEEAKASKQLLNAQAKMRSYIKETKLTRDYDREYVAGYNRAV